MYPAGLATSASDDELNISFQPTPDYAAIAEAAAPTKNGDAWMKGVRARTVHDFKVALECAKTRLSEDKAMLIEALL